MLRIAHLSDIHFGDENPLALAAVTDWLRREPCDLVVVSGDVTFHGARDEFAAAAAWLSALPAPALVTPGNHDTPYYSLLLRLLVPFRRFEKWIGPARAQTHLGPGVAAYGINTARGAQPRFNWSKGKISSNQVTDAVTWLQAAPSKSLRIVVCHHPLEETADAPMSGRVWGGSDAIRTLATAGVDLILTGHVHAPFAVALPLADGKTYAVGAGTLSTRERGVSAGFGLIEADEGEIRMRALAWTGSDISPQGDWAFPRRKDGS